jgi:transcriptional regulator with XRE-family HTH domain
MIIKLVKEVRLTRKLVPFREFVYNRGIKQSWIAEQLGITRSAVNYWATGRQIPSFKNIQRLSELFGTNLYQVFYPKAKVNLWNKVFKHGKDAEI